MTDEKGGFEFEPATNDLGVTIRKIERDSKELCSALESFCKMPELLKKYMSVALDLLLKSSSGTKAIDKFKEISNESQTLLESFSNLLAHVCLQAELIHAEAQIAVARQQEEWLEFNYGDILEDAEEGEDEHVL